MQLIEIVSFVYQVADVFAFLVLAAAGLAIIFGMMGIINMGHGELIAMGGYVTTYAAQAGAPLPFAMLAGAGEASFSVYRLVLVAIAVLVLAVLHLVFMRTRFGAPARDHPVHAGRLHRLAGREP